MTETAWALQELANKPEVDPEDVQVLQEPPAHLNCS